jgi:hypothetical protein
MEDMRISIAGAMAAWWWLACAACSPSVVTTTVVVAPTPDVAARQLVPLPVAQAGGRPGETTPPASPPGTSIVIEGSALEGLGDGELARRAMETTRRLRGVAGIGRRDEDAARDGTRLTYAKTAYEVRRYILGQYGLVRIEVLDEERELTRRLGDRVQGSDAIFEAPGDVDGIDGAADALEALARRLVVDP